MSSGGPMSDVHLPADYAIDALALETDRRSKAQGRPYSYGQLIADTTIGQREQMAESYRKAMEREGRKGRYRLRSGEMVVPVVSDRDVEDQVIARLEQNADPGE